MARGHPDFKFSAYVQTLAADNIVLDKLTVGAITETKRTLQNAGPVYGFTSATGSARHGKFFPRQARGWLTGVGAWCENTSDKDETLTFWFSPLPGMGALVSESLTVPAGAKPGLYTLATNRLWPYDSLFVWVVSSSTKLRYAYDKGEPTDAYHSGDSGLTWSRVDRRYHFYVGMAGQTCGDLPVSGIVNTIRIPSSSSILTSDVVSVDAGETKTFLEVEGMGFTQFLCIYAYRTLGSTPADYIHVIFTIDGVSTEHNISGLRGLVEGTLNTPTPIVFTRINDTVGDQYYTFWWKTPFYFRKLFKLEAKNTLTEPGNIFNMATTYQIAKVV